MDCGKKCLQLANIYTSDSVFMYTTNPGPKAGVYECPARGDARCHNCQKFARDLFRLDTVTTIYTSTWNEASSHSFSIVSMINSTVSVLCKVLGVFQKLAPALDTYNRVGRRLSMKSGWRTKLVLVKVIEIVVCADVTTSSTDY